MKKFSFRLERLLKLKERLEDQKKQALALARSRIENQREELRALNLERERQREEERSSLSGSVNVSLLRSYSRHFHKLKADEFAGLQMAGVLSKEEEAKRKELVSASQEKRALEDYKEKMKLRHDEEAEKRERIEEDELSAQRYILTRLNN